MRSVLICGGKCGNLIAISSPLQSQCNCEDETFLLYFYFYIIIIIRNPINSIRHQYAADIAREEKEREEREREEKRIQKEREEARENLIRLKAKSKASRFRRPLNVEALTPAHAEYWAEGVGEGGNKPWKFACVCGERCSSYENFRYHPVGRMFECSACSIWSHVLCVLGNISEDDIEELTVRCIDYAQTAFLKTIAD